MRTTLDIPDDLLARARECSGKKTKKAVVCWALEEVVRQKAISELMALRGKVKFRMTPEEMREREIRGERYRRKLMGPRR
jgi:Arc/MetJ family transcription regulator